MQVRPYRRKHYHPVQAELTRRRILQRDAAAAVGVQPIVLSQVLTGKKASWPKLRHRLADYLERPVDDLFPDEARR